jgi:hypothetical protein
MNSSSYTCMIACGIDAAAAAPILINTSIISNAR